MGRVRRPRRPWIRASGRATAAIAERFWSPRETTDVDSMYARMEAVSRVLEWTGVRHRANYGPMLDRLAGGQPPSRCGSGGRLRRRWDWARGRGPATVHQPDAAEPACGCRAAGERERARAGTGGARVVAEPAAAARTARCCASIRALGRERRALPAAGRRERPAGGAEAAVEGSLRAGRRRAENLDYLKAAGRLRPLACGGDQEITRIQEAHRGGHAGGVPAGESAVGRAAVEAPVIACKPMCATVCDRKCAIDEAPQQAQHNPAKRCPPGNSCGRSLCPRSRRVAWQLEPSGYYRSAGIRRAPTRTGVRIADGCNGC